MQQIQREIPFPITKSNNNQNLNAATVTINNGMTVNEFLKLVENINILQNPPDQKKKYEGSKWAITKAQKEAWQKIVSLLGMNESQALDVGVELLMMYACMNDDDKSLSVSMMKSLSQKNLNSHGTV